MTIPIDIRADHLRIVHDVLARHLPDGVKVWVFGSRATWTTKDSSDLDLALEGDGKIPARSLAALESAFENSALPFAVDVVDAKRVGGRFRKIVTEQRVPLPMFPRAGTRHGRADGRAAPSRTALGSGTPDKWATVRLGDVADLLTGFPFRSDRYVSDSGAPRLLRGDNIAQGRLRWHGAKRWSADAPAALEPFWLSAGDVVLAMDRPWIEAGLKFASVQRSDLPALLVQRVARLRGGEDLDTRFLRYVIGRRDFSDYVLSVQTGTAVPHLSARQIEDYQFRLPPVHHQRAVAHILGTLDDKINLNRRLNGTLEAMARALFRSWFVDFDPVRAKMDGRDIGLPKEIADLFPNRMADSEPGQIPEGWTVSEIGAEVDAVGGGTPSTKEPAYWNGGEHHWATPKDLSKSSSAALLETDRKITDAGVQRNQLRSSPGWDGPPVVSCSYRLPGDHGSTNRRKPGLHRHDLQQAAARPVCAVVVLRES